MFYNQAKLFVKAISMLLFNAIHQANKVSFCLLLILFIPLFATAQKKTFKVDIDSLEHEINSTKLVDTNLVKKLVNLEYAYYKSGSENLGNNLKRIEEICQKLNYQKGLGFCYILKSIVAIRKSDLKQSLEYANKALAVGLKLNHPKIVASAYERLADLNSETEAGISIGDTQKAIYFYQKQAEWAAKTPDRVYNAIPYTNIGKLYLDSKQFDKAEEYYDKALNLLEQSKGMPGATNNMGYVLNSKGRLYNEQKKYTKAIVYLKEAQQVADEIQNRELKNLSYYHLGVSYYNLKEYEIAKKYLLKSLENTSTSHIIKIYLPLEMLANVDEKLNNYEGAYGYLKKELALKDSLFVVEKNKAFLELQTKYETKEKEQANLLLKTQNSQISTQKQNYLILFITALISLGGSIVFYLKLQHKNKLLAETNELKDKLFSIIAHDLKRPANAFQNAVQTWNLLLKRQQYDKLQEIGAKAEIMAADMNLMIDNIFRWSLAEQNSVTTHFSEFDVVSLLKDLQLEFNEWIGLKKLNIKFIIQTTPIVKTDKTILLIILRNLLSNAIKFSSENQAILISYSLENNLHKISVVDNGIGIPNEIKEQLLRSNTGVNRSGVRGEKGMGMGLYICNKLANYIKATITFESQQNVGTTFSVIF